MGCRFRRGSFRRLPVAAVALFLALVPGAPGPAGAVGAEGGEAAPLQALRLRGLTARPAALLMSGQAGGQVPLAVLALPLPPSLEGRGEPAGGQSSLAVIVEMGLAALSAGGEGDLRSEVYVYATDAAGAPRSSLTQTFTVPADRLHGEGAAVAARFLGHLELPPGQYDLRVLVVGRTPEQFGLYRAPLEVPDFSGGEPVLLPPIVTAPPETGWLPVREAPHGSLREDPLQPFGLSSWPSARPVLPPDWEGELVVLGRRMGPLPGDLGGRLWSIGDDPMGRAVLVSATHASPIGELERWRLAVRLEPTAAGPARWQWQTSVEGAAVPPGREVWVAATEASTGRPWLASEDVRTGPAGTGQARGEVEGIREAPAKISDRELAKIARRYPRVLLEAARGNRSRAMAELAELEASFVTGRSLPAVEALQQAELRVLAQATAKAPESLVPVVWLYLDLFERYVREHQLLLAAHARTLVRELTDLYLKSAQGASSRRLAADLLTAFAGSLQALSLSTESESALRQAVTLEPGHRIALRGLAASHEAARQDSAAIAYLEELRSLEPEDSEVCARLARLQQRTGRRSQAEATFRLCVEKVAPAWAVAVAYEELALLLGRSARWPEAEAILEEGRRRLPGEPRLGLLLAYAQDRVGRPAQGHQTLSGLDFAAASAAASPRARYGRWPRELFAALRRNLEPEVDRRWKALDEVLAEEVS